MREKVRIVRVAGVQMESKNGLIKANLEHAAGLIEQAAEKGAKLILLPELMPVGYIMTRAIWDAAEPKEGATVKWLKENSKRLKVWLGTSFLEADGADFFNTFVLTTPDGEEAGRVRKQTPAVSEAYFTKGDMGPHVIDTEFGKIGVGICYENLLCYLPQMMYHQSVDMMLLPHSAPTPTQSFLCPRKYVEFYNNSLRESAQRLAHLLGVPAVMVNKYGPWQTPLPGLLPTQDSSFPGLSTIADSDGTVKAQLSDKEGVIVEDVTLDPSCKTHTLPQCWGRWSLKVPWQNKLWQAVEAFGRLSYSFSSERKRRAREISQKI